MRQVPDRNGGITDPAMAALIGSLSRLEPTAPTWCAGWSAHSIAAHITGAAQERADLIEEHLAGLPGRATRSWEEREAPLRELDGQVLRDRLLIEATRFERNVAAMDPEDALEYTGWTMTAGRMRAHSHSEAALHRWDLVGDDALSRMFMSEPRLTDHALAAFAAIPALNEAQRWSTAAFSVGSFRLRSAGLDDVLIRRGSAPLLVPQATAAPADPVVELDVADRLLVLWGRVPPELRPAGGPVDVDQLVEHLLP
ncbi:maleylpyruvate isomerase N-terminal domain-containing protein [Pseudonocardia adelaidensis]